MILVTGATGNVGSEAVQQLLERGIAVRALVRNTGKAADLANAGAEIVEGDLEDLPTLEKALVGVTTVVLVSPGVPAMEENVIHVAAGVGANHIVKISAASAHPDSPVARRRWHARVENTLKASGMGYVMLRSNAYMQNILMAAPAIAETDGFASCHAAGRIGLIDARDVAAVAALVAADPTAHRDKTYRLSGAQLLAYPDLATILSRVLGRQITYTAITNQENRRAMIIAGVPAPVAEMNVQAFDLVAAGDSAWLTDEAAALLGHAPRSFEQFAIDYAADFSSHAKRSA
jgi:uncharacterized protein YbjT (DUF2867 family)